VNNKRESALNSVNGVSKQNIVIVAALALSENIETQVFQKQGVHREQIDFLWA